jgi:heat shock protein HtpX
VTLQQQIRSNHIRTAVVVLAFALLIVVFAAASAVFVGRPGAIGLLAFGLAYGLFAWWNAGRMIGSLTHAKPLQKSDDPELYRLVENVSIAAGLPATPPVYLIDDPAPNAFAAGSRPSTIYVGVTSGLRKLMPPRELEAVLAHEISHIRNRDVRLMTLAAVLVGVIAIISDFAFRMAFFGGRGNNNRNPVQLIAAVVAIVLAPLAAVMLQMALSRRREYLADASAGAILNDPEAMALALRRLELDQSEVAFADGATAHLFIESPKRSVKGPGAVLGGLFQTHPPLADRIHALEEAGGFRLETSPDATPIGA